MWLCGIFSYANKCESQNEVPQSCIKYAQPKMGIWEFGNFCASECRAKLA